MTAEIEQAKQDLARDIAELKQEATATGRKLAIAVGAIAAAYATYRVARVLLRRGAET